MLDKPGASHLCKKMCFFCVHILHACHLSTSLTFFFVQKQLFLRDKQLSFFSSPSKQTCESVGGSAANRLPSSISLLFWTRYEGASMTLLVSCVGASGPPGDRHRRRQNHLHSGCKHLRPLKVADSQFFREIPPPDSTTAKKRVASCSATQLCD